MTKQRELTGISFTTARNAFSCTIYIIASLWLWLWRQWRSVDAALQYVAADDWKARSSSENACDCHTDREAICTGAPRACSFCLKRIYHNVAVRLRGRTVATVDFFITIRIIRWQQVLEERRTDEVSFWIYWSFVMFSEYEVYWINLCAHGVFFTHTLPCQESDWEVPIGVFEL